MLLCNSLIMSFIMMVLSLSASANNTLYVDVPKNQSTFDIVLAANPTTGFQWSVVHYNQELLTFKHSVYQGPDTKLIGAGGHMLFTFSLNKGKSYPKTTDLFFKYARPWEQSTTGSKQKVTVHFVLSK